MRYVSTFAGVGGFDVAFDAAGMTCVGQVEIDKFATKVLDKHWPGVERHDDVRTAIEWADARGITGNVDIVCGGFPCQDLSVAGRRAGLTGERSGLFYDLLRFADHVGADALLLENVPGLLTSHQGRDFGVLLNALADSGFVDIEWSVLDAQHFGVPQRRRRIFILARRGGLAGGPPVFAESSGCKRHPGSGDAERAIPASEAGGSVSGAGVVSALTSTGVGTCGADDNQAQAGHLIPFVKAKRAQNDNDDETWETDRPSPTLNQFDSGDSRATTVLVGVGVRRLTPVETERLQGFPDGHTDVCSDTQRYKQMGNAVAVPVVRWIAEKIMERQ